MNYGTLAWARQTGGEVTGVERLRQWLRTVKFQVASRVRRRPRDLGFGSSSEIERALVETELPPTPLVHESLTLISSLSPPALVGHVLRTYAFGTLFGLRDGLEWNREVFALAALLHDVALARREPTRCCFAHDGAEQSLEFLGARGLDDERRHRVADAICLHLRVEVPPALGVEAHLVHAGAGLDVVGLRASELDPAMRRAVLSRHPRGALVEVLLRLFAEERRRHPTARISRWMSLGFGSSIRHNPLDRP